LAEGALFLMICERLHRLFNHLSRHHFPFDKSSLPRNGIYVLFEQGESAHGLDRIVRIGTHTGQNNLRQRLAEHFLTENKDRSIFRKNIGRALLNRRNDPFLAPWEMDLTSNNTRQQYGARIDHGRLSEIETEVSAVIRTTFTFCAFQVDDKQRRLELEECMIATVNRCGDCGPSGDWLGNYSTKRQIRQSGLWLVQGLNGRVLTNRTFRHWREESGGPNNEVHRIGHNVGLAVTRIVM
jgi:hypothetical protein